MVSHISARRTRSIDCGSNSTLPVWSASVWEIARNLISDGFTPVAIKGATELVFMAFFPEILGNCYRTWQNPSKMKALAQHLTMANGLPMGSPGQAKTC
jgi:hypothetical protein